MQWTPLGQRTQPRLSSLALACATALAGLLPAAVQADRGDGRGDRHDDAQQHHQRLPAFVTGEVRVTRVDGASDDLLTAGLGATGLASAVPPAAANPLAPTGAELRRLAIHTNYRALVDMTANGGYGRLYGPTVGAPAAIAAADGRVAGVEYLAYSDDGSGRRNVGLLVQIPAHFNPKMACVMTATSSGSRGIYGAISTGEWGLKKGCAVAYTDKGTGAAPHDLQNDTVALIDGTRSSATAAGKVAQFNAGLDVSALAQLNAATPNRFAFKHAHSQQNPEKDWGRSTLQAIEFAFWALNQEYPASQGRDGDDADGHDGPRIRRDNTTVIASSISNGGGSAIAAAELDDAGWIDGVAVTEPAVELPANPAITVRRGGVVQPTVGKPLIDFTTYANVYQLCAALAPEVAGAPGLAFVVASIATNRCSSLADKGLVSGSTTAERASDALARLKAYGWEPEAAVLQASHAAFEIASAVSVTFASALSRASVADHLCGYSYGAVNAAFGPAPLPAALLATMAATGNGVPPAAGVQLINDRGAFAVLRDLVSFSPSTLRQDANLDGALCLRGLVTGSDAAALRLQAGLDETRRSGNLQHKPTLIVHGRNDALLPVNHTSRAYAALNSAVEGRHSRLSYIEVTNAQHFDSFIGLPALLPGFDTRYVSLHIYLNRALDAMYEHLTRGNRLPPSQVVRTTPRGGVPGAAPALTEANLPPIARRPARADRIRARAGTLDVPE